MAAQPSPLARKLQKLLEVALTGGAALKAQLEQSEIARAAAEQAVEEFRARARNTVTDTNAIAARDAEIQQLRASLEAQQFEVSYLRSTMNRLANGGVFVTGLMKA